MKNRGFVFTTDATIAAFLMVFVVSTVAYLSLQASVDPYGSVQLERLGGDALVVLERSNVLSSGNESLINDTLNATLSSGIGRHVKVETFWYVGSSFNLINTSEYGDDFPLGKTTYGRRLDMVSAANEWDMNYSIMRIWVWEK